MQKLPEHLVHRPFTRAEALESGITSRMLQGRRFVRVHPAVYRYVDHVMTREDRVEAARLALPPGARTTDITRLQLLGLDFGPERPSHFVVQGDLHLALDDVFLHRTVLMPLSDDTSVDVAAAYLAYCSRARVIDAVKVGDWLIHGKHVTANDVATLAEAQIWRAGAVEALWILQHLDGDSRSLPESETRVVLTFAGLPTPEVNQALDPAGELPYIPDLYYRAYKVAVEYEGSQHQQEREIYENDIERYAAVRRFGCRYVQVTKKTLSRPRALVGQVFRELLDAGYDGPPPDLGADWRRLFRRVSEMRDLPRRSRRRELAERA